MLDPLTCMVISIFNPWVTKVLSPTAVQQFQSLSYVMQEDPKKRLYLDQLNWIDDFQALTAVSRATATGTAPGMMQIVHADVTQTQATTGCVPKKTIFKR